MLSNHKLEKTTTHFGLTEVMFWHLLETRWKTTKERKKKKTLCQDSLCPRQDSNRIPSKYHCHLCHLSQSIPNILHLSTWGQTRYVSLQTIYKHAQQLSAKIKLGNKKTLQEHRLPANAERTLQHGNEKLEQCGLRVIIMGLRFQISEPFRSIKSFWLPTEISTHIHKMP